MGEKEGTSEGAVPQPFTIHPEELWWFARNASTNCLL